MGVGGKRQGAGRKPVSYEISAREICQSAIIRKFGTLEKGIEYLLESEEPTLIKFAYEHAFGKPVERVAATDSNGNDLANVSDAELKARADMLSKAALK